MCSSGFEDGPCRDHLSGSEGCPESLGRLRFRGVYSYGASCGEEAGASRIMAWLVGPLFPLSLPQSFPLLVIIAPVALKLCTNLHCVPLYGGR